MSDFRARFAAFDDVEDARVQIYIDDAANIWTDRNLWAPSDWPLAVLYLAAHNLYVSPDNTSSALTGGAVIPADLFVNRIHFGERSLGLMQRAGTANQESMAGPGEGLLATTSYGQMYLQLRARNIIPILTV